MNYSKMLFARDQSGLGLVELMIAMLIGILLSGALVQAYIGSRTTYQLQDSMSIVEENGRFATSYLTKELRMAGYIGCGSIDQIKVNDLAGLAAGTIADLPTALDNTQIIRAGAAGGSTYVALGIDAVAGTDVLTIRKGSNVSAHLNSAMAGSGADVILTDNLPGLEVNDYAIISDCTNADLFIVKSIGAVAPITLGHASAFSKASGYGTDAEVLGFESTYYYIADTGRKTKLANLPIYSLYMKTRAAGSNGFTDGVELVEGVENMKLAFGLDTDGDGNVDKYLKTADMAEVNWGQIVSVQINLLLQGVDDKAVGNGKFAQTVRFMGTDITNDDGRLRQSFTVVAAVRNRLQ